MYIINNPLEGHKVPFMMLSCWLNFSMVQYEVSLKGSDFDSFGATVKVKHASFFAPFYLYKSPISVSLISVISDFWVSGCS